MLKIVRAILALVGLLVLVFLAIDNREAVPVSFWPLPYAQAFPVYGIFFVGLFIGAFMGGLAVWLGGHRARAEAHRMRRQDRRQQAEAAKVKQAQDEEIMETARRRTAAIATPTPVPSLAAPRAS